MKDYLAKKDIYNVKYADAIMTIYRNLKYGVASCYDQENIDLIMMRKELAEWQEGGLYGDAEESCSTC